MSLGNGPLAQKHVEVDKNRVLERSKLKLITADKNVLEYQLILKSAIIKYVLVVTEFIRISTAQNYENSPFLQIFTPIKPFQIPRWMSFLSSFKVLRPLP